MTPVACHTFIRDMLAVNGRAASGEERDRCFGMAVATLARFYVRRPCRDPFMATGAGFIAGRDGSSGVIKAATFSAAWNTVAADTSNSGSGTRFAGCLEVAGEARVRIYGKMALSVDGGVATGAPQLRTTRDRAQVLRMVEPVSLPHI